MYAYIKGEITQRNPTAVTIEAAGVGYHIHISLFTYGQIEGLPSVRLWTQLIVREDAQILYGFATQDERELFNLLISVSGIGPNTARLVLSGMTPEDARAAIIAEDAAAFRRVKGVGPKTAKRLIVELNDKMAKSSVSGEFAIPAGQSNTSRQEALSALVTLGFQKQQVQKAIARVSGTMDTNTSTEQWIKAALKELGS